MDEDDLVKISKRRRSEQWGHYIEEKAAVGIYGSTKKRATMDKLTLVQFFDLGINEDIFDVLSIKFPKYDFLILMDQSSGHGKKWRAV